MIGVAHQAGLQLGPQPLGLLLVGGIALLTTVAGLRHKFFDRRLLETWRTTVLFVGLVVLSTAAAMVVAAIRLLGLTALGVAVPVPLRTRGQRSDRDVSWSLMSLVGFLIIWLDSELAKNKDASCQAVTEAIRLNIIDGDDFARTLARRLADRRAMTSREKRRRAAAFKAARRRWRKRRDPSRLVDLAYSWRAFDLLEL